MPCGLTLSVLLKVSSLFLKENRRNTQKPTLWLPRRTSLKQWRKLDYMRICHIWQNIWTLETRYEHLKTTKRNNQICDPRALTKMWSKKKFQTYVPFENISFHPAVPQIHFPLSTQTEGRPWPWSVTGDNAETTQKFSLPVLARFLYLSDRNFLWSTNLIKVNKCIMLALSLRKDWHLNT